LLAIRFVFFSDTSFSLLDPKPPAASLVQGEIDFCISYTSRTPEWHTGGVDDASVWGSLDGKQHAAERNEKSVY
jgi:hypothetical protein